MTNSLSSIELHKKLEATPSTDGWDVLVAYSTEKLNAFLRQYWGNSGRFSNIKFERQEGPPRHEYTMEYELSLGAPSLSFEGANAVATLVMSIEGTANYKGDPPEDAIKIGKDKYNLIVDVPIASVDGNERGTKPPQPSNTLINFDDGKETSHYLVFHFANEKAVWKVQCLDPNDPMKSDMYRTVSNLSNMFQSEAQSIEYSLAQVSNATESDVSDLMRPQQFAFSSTDGVLMVFIKTKGGGERGSAKPVFGVQHVSPIPQGHSAAIVISRRLFLDSYLVKQIQKTCPGLNGDNAVKSLDVTSGIKLEVTLKDYAKFSYSRIGHQDFDVSRLDHKLSEAPLVLKIDHDGYSDLAPKYNWDWDHENGTWTRGRVFSTHSKFSAKISAKPREALALKDDAINMSIAFRDEDQPKVYKTNEAGYYFEFGKFDLELPELNFFITQNVFAPGQRIVQTKDVMLPYDLVLVGDIVDSK